MFQIEQRRHNPDGNRSDLGNYVSLRLITPSVMEDMFLDKSNKYNHADFHHKRRPAGLIIPTIVMDQATFIHEPAPHSSIQFSTSFNPKSVQWFVSCVPCLCLFYCCRGNILTCSRSSLGNHYTENGMNHDCMMQAIHFREQVVHNQEEGFNEKSGGYMICEL